MQKIIKGLLVFGIVMLIPFSTYAELVIAPWDVHNLPEWKMDTTPSGGKLLLSDCPETVPDDGIMYQDTIQGSGRVFFYHVNGTEIPKKMAILLKNNNNKELILHVGKHSLAGPSMDYWGVGKEAQISYFKSSEGGDICIPAQGTALLSPELSQMAVYQGQLVTAIYDFRTNLPVQITTLMLPLRADPALFIKWAQVLSSDSTHLRGTYDYCDRIMNSRIIYDPRKNGVVAITLADNQIDKFLKGIDATDGSPSENTGNYGVVYHLWMPSTAGGQVDYWLYPWGGAYAGAMPIRHQFNNHLQLTPSDRTVFGGSGQQEILKLASYESGNSLWFTFSPPGASNLPIRIILSPKNKE